MQNLGNIPSIYQNPATTLSWQDQCVLPSQPFLPWHCISFAYQLFFLFAMGVSYHDHPYFRNGRELQWPFSFLQWAWVIMAIFLFNFSHIGWSYQHIFLFAMGWSYQHRFTHFNFSQVCAAWSDFIHSFRFLPYSFHLLPVEIPLLEVILFQACPFLPPIARFTTGWIHQHIYLAGGLQYLIWLIVCLFSAGLHEYFEVKSPMTLQS